ncbi:GILT-like protein F37H8.5 [Pectinophora gossypiella]|uniref:Uncharacterized protein n=2 Tax=Pectinophora gossypiella TaxID=13191 RepID=A0A1E1W2E6_PECGO|nr:GILT-like protein F37H8.5 [Pectinophora gossypiella]
MAKVYFCVVLCLLSLNHIDAVELVNGKVKITVGTTSGCSDTMNFITNQLVDTYNTYKDFMEVEFVPWGRTRYEPDGSMWCQFNHVGHDCFANRLHRCVLDHLRGDQDAQVEYMACEFAPPYPAFQHRSYACVQSAGLPVVPIDHCVDSSGQDLDDAAQAAAAEPMQIINFVPSIHFNDVIDRSVHDQARRRLKSMICFALAEDSSTGVTDCQI